MTCTDPCPAGTTCTNNVCVCSAGLICQIARCGTGSTTISGKVYDPAGVNPLYNVIVYSRDNTTLDPDYARPHVRSVRHTFREPIAATLSGTDGSFTLTNAPSGTNIPIVFQIGKWSRQINIPTVTACQNNTLAASLTRLPRNKTDGIAEHVSQLPQIALTAGLADRLQCLLRRMGVDSAEFTNPNGTGSISMYRESNSPGEMHRLRRNKHDLSRRHHHLVEQPTQPRSVRHDRPQLWWR